MVVMDRFYCLLKADGDQQTDANRSDVDEEVFPGMNCLVRWMYVEHGYQVLLNGIGCTHRVRIDFGRGWCGNRTNRCIGRYISRSSFRAFLFHYLTASLIAIRQSLRMSLDLATMTRTQGLERQLPRNQFDPLNSRYWPSGARDRAAERQGVLSMPSRLKPVAAIGQS